MAKVTLSEAMIAILQEKLKALHKRKPNGYLAERQRTEVKAKAAPSEIPDSNSGIAS